MSKEKEEIMNVTIDQMTEENCIIKEGNIKKINKEGPLESMEEWYLTCYIKEFMEAGVILDADKNVTKIELSEKITHASTEYMKTKTKLKFRHIFNVAGYTPDFNIQWNPKWKDVIFSLFNSGKHMAKHKVPFISCKSNSHSSIFECKGRFMTSLEITLYSILVKWLYDKYKIYVQVVKVPDLFKDTFTPQAYIDDMIYHRPNSKKGIKPGDSKLKYKPVTCKEYLDSIKDKNPANQMDMI